MTCCIGLRKREGEDRYLMCEFPLSGQKYVFRALLLAEGTDVDTWVTSSAISRSTAR